MHKTVKLDLTIQLFGTVESCISNNAIFCCMMIKVRTTQRFDSARCRYMAVWVQNQQLVPLRAVSKSGQLCKFCVIGNYI